MFLKLIAVVLIAAIGSPLCCCNAWAEAADAGLEKTCCGNVTALPDPGSPIDDPSAPNGPEDPQCPCSKGSAVEKCSHEVAVPVRSESTVDGMDFNLGNLLADILPRPFWVEESGSIYRDLHSDIAPPDFRAVRCVYLL